MASCECGEFQVQAHAVLKGTNKCVLCGGRVEIGFIGTMSKFPQTNICTTNGSYILPNGLVVLDKDDLDSYLEGTLKFYDRNIMII